jgi:hypothetical protein
MENEIGQKSLAEETLAKGIKRGKLSVIIPFA